MTEQHKDNTAQRQQKTDILSLPVKDAQKIYLCIYSLYLLINIYSFILLILRNIANFASGSEILAIVFFYFGSRYVTLYLNYNYVNFIDSPVFLLINSEQYIIC